MNIYRNIFGTQTTYVNNNPLDEDKEKCDLQANGPLPELAEQTIQNSIPTNLEEGYYSSLLNRVTLAVKYTYHQSTAAFQSKHEENIFNNAALIQQEPIDPLLSIIQDYKAFTVDGEEQQSFMSNIRGYVTDKALVKYGASWQDQTIDFQAPHQFLMDIIRMSIMYQEVYPEDRSEKGIAEICGHIMERMGKGRLSAGRVAFDNMAALLNQGSFADPIILLDQKLKQKSYENGEFDTSNILSAGNLNDEDTEQRTMIYKLNIDTNDNVYLSLKMIGKIYKPEKKYGFFIHERDIVIPLEELSLDLKIIPVQQRFPSLQLNDTFSGIIHDVNEAIDHLNREEKLINEEELLRLKNLQEKTFFSRILGY